MLNILWPIFIIISFTYSIITGKVESLNNGIFESAKSAVELSLSLLGTICLWNGIMKVASKTSLITKLNKLIKPLMKVLFPEVGVNSKAYEEMSMNIVANILGLGNAATPMGLKAMQTLQKENRKKDTLSNSMVMFIVLNTASIQLVPTTVIAIMSRYGL